jgi:predicted NUDIX family NTP pyrophosphohydrolase
LCFKRKLERLFDFARFVRVLLYRKFKTDQFPEQVEFCIEREKMAKRSAGLLLYRFRDGELEVFLVHPGGPFWRRKDAGAWSIPKGEAQAGEDPLTAARREFTEETGHSVEGEFLPLASIKQPGGKVVEAWAIEADCDAAAIRSNTFSMEWPPHSGKQQEFPEVDRAAWFTLEAAREKILPGQGPLLAELQAKVLT